MWRSFAARVFGACGRPAQRARASGHVPVSARTCVATTVHARAQNIQLALAKSAAVCRRVEFDGRFRHLRGHGAEHCRGQGGRLGTHGGEGGITCEWRASSHQCARHRAPESEAPPSEPHATTARTTAPPPVCPGRAVLTRPCFHIVLARSPPAPCPGLCSAGYLWRTRRTSAP